MNFHEPVVTKRNENEQHQLINIGSCGLHTIDGAFKTGFEKSIGAYYVFMITQKLTTRCNEIQQKPIWLSILTILTTENNCILIF